MALTAASASVVTTVRRYKNVMMMMIIIIIVVVVVVVVSLGEFCMVGQCSFLWCRHVGSRGTRPLEMEGLGSLNLLDLCRYASAADDKGDC